jgi:hypothetical protein
MVMLYFSILVLVVLFFVVFRVFLVGELVLIFR